MKIGCFALIQPFSPMRRQFELIRELGFDYADLTDNHDGATLGTEYGFSASFSLDSHPATILDMVNEFKLTLTSVCAHANLLDPTSPDRYGTAEIIEAIVKELLSQGFDGPTTLEIAGEEAVKVSAERLRQWAAL